MNGGSARARIAALAVCGLATIASRAEAQSPDARTGALAQVLFDEAVALMAAGHFDEACPKLAESQRLDPAGGTLLNLASCLENQGQLASAYATYADALGAAVRDGRKDREALVRERLAAIQPRIPRLELRVAGATPGLEIKLDGTKLGATSWRSALPMDAGSHTLEASAPGHAPWTHPFVVTADSARVTIDVPALAALPAAPPPRATTPPPSPGAAPGSDGRPLATGLWIGGGVAAAAGLVVGAVALASKGVSDDHCPTPTTCDAEGVRAMSTARTLAWTANVAIGVGALAAIGGFVVHFTAPRSAAVRNVLLGTF